MKITHFRELINGQLTSEPTLHSDTLATTVTFYDTRVANKFRRVLRSVQGVGRTTEKTPAEATTVRWGSEYSAASIFRLLITQKAVSTVAQTKRLPLYHKTLYGCHQ
ncbi:hypothetical protein Pmar_PMAR012830 [Perkinsus marinus ATCC 50983]|uniref:Uncharacterized protein n=1 Tax=Perkinsus marinus (strain ATCC 50983 / TXsc) TaxID=423536 RepID=C5L5I7_PERM5|nr:hypothetical protein Pmar_PMAR012830 [Perkinsus marinus ATCC 50983]EER08012.1 hypothetical protein Pmar_PMAR012830 [Perkinsus marinus ATCC 50983]|eukprot:XP_002776196.1 hypothetical protein Pmar_PMAR012830 [Perkinsus marinus ATCC 50983]